MQLYVTINIILSSHTAPISSILVIEQSSFTLRNTVDSLFLGVSRLNQELSTVTTFYAKLDAYQAQQDLNRVLQPYPLPDHEDKAGMEIELR